MFWDTPSIPALYGSIIPFLALDVIAIVLRFVMRRRLGQKFQADDWLMFPAFTGVIGLATMYFYGLGTKSLGYRYMLLPPPGTDMSSPDFVPDFAGPVSRIVRTRRVSICTPLNRQSLTDLVGILFLDRVLSYSWSHQDQHTPPLPPHLHYHTVLQGCSQHLLHFHDHADQCMVPVLDFCVRLHVQEGCSDSVHKPGKSDRQVCRHVCGRVLTFHL